MSMEASRDLGIDEKTGHHYVEPKGFEGIVECLICRGAEGSLPSRCPGSPMSTETQDGVYAGRLDFDGVAWRWAAQTVTDDPIEVVLRRGPWPEISQSPARWCVTSPTRRPMWSVLWDWTPRKPRQSFRRLLTTSRVDWVWARMTTRGRRIVPRVAVHIPSPRS